MTLEEAQARILELEERNSELETENQNYITRTNELTGELEKVRELNQKYFLKLSAHYSPTPEEPEEDPAPTCEEFARTLTI